MPRGYRDEDDGDDGVSVEDVSVVKATERALLVSHAGEETWVPKSVVHDDSEVYDDSSDGKGPGTLVLKRWWARDNGFDE